MDNSLTTLSAGILLFLIMDPLGNIPLFLTQLRNVAPPRRRRVLLRELIIALIVLFAFLLGGGFVLRALQLRPESISIAGGIVLFLIGVKMIFPPRDGDMFGAGVGMLYTPILVDRMRLSFPSGFAVANILRALTDPRLLRRSIGRLGGGTAAGLAVAALLEHLSQRGDEIGRAHV